MKKLFSIIAAVLVAGSMFAETATIKYPGGTTTNMVGEGTNNAETVGLDATEFEVLADKGGNQNLPGLNTAGDIRLYANKNDGNGNIITVKLIPAGKIDSIKLDISQTATFVVKAGETAVAEAEGKYVINGSSFSIQNTTTGATTQLRLKSITIYYTLEAVTDPTIKVKNSLDFGTVYVSEGQKASIDLTLDVEGLNLTEAIEYSCVEPTTTITGTLTKDGGTLAIHIEAAAGTYTSAIHFTSDLGGGATVANETVIKGEVKEVVQYDVAEAIAAGLNKGDVIMLRGVVTNMAAKGSNFATYGSLKIYVKDATNAAGEFQLFNCMSLEEAKFASTTPAYDPESTQWADFTSVTDANGNELNVGDTVIAFGKYELYNEVYELQQGCYLVDVIPGEGVPAQTIDITINTGVMFNSGLIAENTYFWQVQAQNDDYYVSLAHVGTTDDVAGTYTQDDLYAEYSYIYDINAEIQIDMASANLQVTVNADESIDVVGTFVGSDGNTYNLNLHYAEPKAETTVNVNITDAQIEESTGVIGVMGEDATGLWVQLFIETETLEGSYTEENLEANQTSIWYNDEDYTLVYTAEFTVTANADGSYTLVGDFLCYDNTLYKVTMIVPGGTTAIGNVEAVKSNVVKAIENGQLFININGVKYNVNGAIVK